MSDFSPSAIDGPELFLGLVLTFWGIGVLIVRALNRHRAARQRAIAIRRALGVDDPCSHPAWKAERLAYRGTGQAIKISCFRCGAPAGDRFSAQVMSSDGTLSIVNQTRGPLDLVLDGALHTLLPPDEWHSYDDVSPESEYAIFLEPPDLRKL